VADCLPDSATFSNLLLAFRWSGDVAAAEQLLDVMATHDVTMDPQVGVAGDSPLLL
jgi:hypothetical protein